MSDTPADEGRTESVRAELKALGYIATFWHVDDLLDQRPDLNHAQAMDVLGRLDSCQAELLGTVKHDVLCDLSYSMYLPPDEDLGLPELSQELQEPDEHQLQGGPGL